jgi:hypothetical protein
MHLYNYYSNMDKSKTCGEELRFQEGGKPLVIEADRDYRVRIIVGLNSPGALMRL